MKKHLTIALLLLLQIGFSQGKTFTVKQIDSIAQANGRYGIADGKISITDDKGKIIGTGGSTTKTYLNYFNQDYYNQLSQKEKNRYNREKDSELIRGDYSQTIHNIDNTSERVVAQFYYHQNKLIYLKLKITRTAADKKEKTLNYQLDQAEIDSDKKIKNEFGMELRQWIKEQNQNLLQFHNKS